MTSLWKSYSFSVLLAEAGTSELDMLTYEPTLSRIRIDEAKATSVPQSAPLNSNTGFETDLSGWTTTNFGASTFTRSTAQAHSGVASALISPDGVDSFLAVYNLASTAGDVAESESYEAIPWVYSPNGYSDVRVRIDWYDNTDTIFASTTAQSFTVVAATWTQINQSGTAPAGAVKAGVRVIMGGTPASTDTLYIDDAELVRPGTTFPSDATRIIERSLDLIHWSVVRGGTEKQIDSAAQPVDDYEFISGEQNNYRIRVFDNSDMLLWTFRASITVTVEEPWLKTILFPFLNRVIAGCTATPVVRSARGGVFPVVGTRLATAVTDIRGGHKYELVIKTLLPAEREAIQAALAPGDVVYLQVPPTYPVPGGHFWVGDTTEDRKDLPWERRWWTLPLTAVSRPGPDLVGGTMTYRALSNRYTSYSELSAAHPSYRALMELIADPSDVVDKSAE